MNFNDIDIDRLRLVNGQCLIEIHSMVEDEIDFNGGKLKLVNKVKNGIEQAHDSDMINLIKSMKRSHYKDVEATREYTKMMAEMHKVADENKEDHEAKQAVRRGVIVKVPEKELGWDGWDFDCEFDAVVGDEVWFDSTHTRQRLEEGEGGFIENGKTYILVPARAIYAAKRNGEIVSMNGYVLGKELPNDRTYGSLFLPESKISKVEVVVPAAREPRYMHTLWSNTKLKKGDIVYMKKQHCIKLDSTMAETSDLVRFQSRIILAIEE
jgi:hypothetical protein